MARGFLYVYERIYKGETEMQTEFRKIPVNGKRTSVADQKRVRKIISDNAHRIAQECSVLVSYKARAGKAKITIKNGSGKAHPWHLIHTDSGSNVYGWVDDGTFD